MAGKVANTRRTGYTFDGSDSTHQRRSAGTPAERLVEGGAAQLQLLQVAVRDPNVGRQGETFVQVLQSTCKRINSQHPVLEQQCCKTLNIRVNVDLKGTE